MRNLVRYLHSMQGAHHVFKTDTLLPVRASCGDRARYGARNPVRAADGPPLKSYNAAIGESSISGISSGAFMAVQFGVAWSSIIKGVGAVAGGPFYCAQASAADFLNGYTLPLATATGPCMAGPPPDLQPMIGEVEAKASAGDIDPLDNIKRQKIYLFHGYNDAVVAKSVTDATAEFYRRYLGESGRGNLYYQESLGAGHSFVVNEQGERGLNTCPANRSPFIDQCGYDQAGIILQHIYGALRPGTIGPLGGVDPKLRSEPLYRRPYRGRIEHGRRRLRVRSKRMRTRRCLSSPRRAARLSAGRRNNRPALCRTDRLQRLGRRQPHHRALSANQSERFPALQSERLLGLVELHRARRRLRHQIRAADRCHQGHAQRADRRSEGLQPGPAEGGDAELIITDTSDTAAALAWTPVAGATSYRIRRASTDNTFRVVGETLGPSYADQGLAPATPYTWQVTALVGASEQSPSSIVRAATRTIPPACDALGSCPP